MPLVPSGEFTERIVVLTVAYDAAGANNESPKSWPDPPAGTQVYSAKVESFSANEVIAQGQNHATGSRRLRIRGQRVPVTTADKVRDKRTGEELWVTGVARDPNDTIIDVSRVKGQETPP